MKNEIDNILNGYHFSVLFEMAEFAGLDVHPNRKKATRARLLPIMKKKFFTSKRVKASYKRLNEVQRRALNRLLLLGGAARTGVLRRMLLSSGVCTRAEKNSDPWEAPPDRIHNFGYSGFPTRQDSTVFEDVIALLTRFGLVFSQYGNPDKLPYKPQFPPLARVFVPEVIKSHLPEPEPEENELAGWTPGDVRKGEPNILLRDLYIYWAYVRENRQILTKTGFMRKRALNAVNNMLLLPDESLKDAGREDESERLFMLRRLLIKLQLISMDAPQSISAGEDPLHIPGFWKQSLSARLADCLESWAAAPDFPRKSKGRPTSGSARQTQAKRAIIEELKGLPPETWFKLDDLYNNILARDMNFLFFSHAGVEACLYSHSGGSMHGMRSRHSDREVVKNYEKSEEAFIRESLSGFLTDIDIVEIGCNADENIEKSWSAFRITRGGKEVLDRYPVSLDSVKEVEDAQEKEESGRIVVQPDFQLIALGDVQFSTLARMDLFADRTRAGRSAMEYRISRESIYRAESIGMDLAEIIDWLSRIHHIRMPENVLHTLRGWSSQRERIVFRTGVSLVRAATPGLLKDVLDAAGENDIPGRGITPTLALIDNDKSGRMASLLVEKEIFPVLSTPRLASSDNSVSIDEKGWIKPAGGAPGIHLPTRLARVAEKAGKNKWRLTPASVKRFGATRNKIRRLLAELSRLNRDALPDKLVERIKVWTGYFGEASVETLTLIEFSSRTVLDELAAHPELAGDLKPFPADKKPLAAVSPKKLSKVKKILGRLGIRFRFSVGR